MNKRIQIKTRDVIVPHTSNNKYKIYFLSPSDDVRNED